MHRTVVLLIALTTLLAPVVVWCQNSAPAPVLQRQSPVWIGYLIMFVLTALVVAVSLMPSKRSHQD